MSSDAFRALVSDDENDQSSTDDAFAALHFVAARRLARAKLTVVDATNVQPEARKPLVALAREYHVLPVAAMLAAAQQTKRSPETGDLLVPIQLVAGARNPLNLEFSWTAA